MTGLIKFEQKLSKAIIIKSRSKNEYTKNMSEENKINYTRQKILL